MRFGQRIKLSLEKYNSTIDSYFWGRLSNDNQKKKYDALSCRFYLNHKNSYILEDNYDKAQLDYSCDNNSYVKRIVNKTCI